MLEVWEEDRIREIVGRRAGEEEVEMVEEKKKKKLGEKGVNGWKLLSEGVGK